MSRIAAPRAAARAAAVDRFGRADVDAARRMDGDEQLRLAGQFAADEQLLLVAAGEQAALDRRPGVLTS